MTVRLCGKRERRGLESMNWCVIELQEALRREKTAHRTRYTHSFSRLLRTSGRMAPQRATFSTGSHFFQRAPSLPQCLVDKIRSVQLEPGSVFPLSTVRNFSPGSKRRRHHNTRTRNQGKQNEPWGKMRAVSNICMVFLMLHTPGVLCLSTRKLHADVHRCAKSWSWLEEGCSLGIGCLFGPLGSLQSI